VEWWLRVSGNVMLALRAVAITDGATSLHSPVFVVGVTTAVVVAGDEHDVATRGRAAAATKYRMKKRGRTGAHTTHAVRSLDPLCE
jgi:hypothetical protein